MSANPRSVIKAARALFIWDYSRKPNDKDFNDRCELVMYERMAKIVLTDAGRLRPTPKDQESKGA